MSHGYCRNNGKFFRQVYGTVKGTNVAPPYANIYVAEALLEAPAKLTAKQLAEYRPTIYKRFIDDGFFVWEKDLASLHEFLHMLNTLLPNLKLTWHIDQHSVPYMDLQITKHVQGDVAIWSVSTYQKPHIRYLYIPYNSFHHIAVLCIKAL
jgi:flavin-dependent dehydrogenase